MKFSLIHITFLVVVLALFYHPAHCQLEAWGDTTICKGGAAHLYASGEGSSYYWMAFPVDPSLLIPQEQNPIVSPQVNTMYVVQTNVATGNLILNGTFELGVTGFYSEYVNNQVSIYEEGTYAVVNDAHTVHPNFYCNHDHTSGSGKFMAVNGAGVPNIKVWYLTLDNVEPGRRYEFSTWITSLVSSNPAILQFSINDVLMGEPFQAYPNTCSWYQFFYLWESDTNTQATISIVNQNTILSGNDFGLDDISFATVLVYFDTVYVEVEPIYNSAFSAPASACAQEVTTVTYTGNAPDTADYHWDFGSAAVLSGSGPGPYEIVHNTPGNNALSLWVGSDHCPSDTTVTDVIIGESPVVTASADATILPYGSFTTLHGNYSGGTGPYSWQWSPASLVTDPGSLNPQTVALTNTTEFTLAVTDDAAGCTGYGTITVEVAGGPLGIGIVAEPDEICEGQQSELSAQPYGGTENYSYSWSSDPPGFSSALPDITVQPDVSTEYTVTVSDGLSKASHSVMITVDENPQAMAGSDITIPYGTITTLIGNAAGGSGNYVYHWMPENLVTDPFARITQTINLTALTTFSLTVTDPATNCTGEPDMINVLISGGPLAVVITSDKPAICKGETATLTANASGGNEGNYSYSWEDDMGNHYPSSYQIAVTPEDTLVFHVAVFDGFNNIENYFELIVMPSAEFTWYGGQQSIIACPLDSVLLKPVPQDPSWDYLWSNGATSDEIVVTATGIGFSILNYTLTAHTPDGCSFSGTAQVIFDFSYCNGIEEDEHNIGLKIIPNPNHGIFSVTWDEKAAISEISMLDPARGIIFHNYHNINNNKVNITREKLPAGLYLLNLKGPEICISRKVLILP